MANNRMWLVHKGTGNKILLAKYTPSSQGGGHGWYMFHLGDSIDDWFDAIQRAPEQGFDWMWGPTDFYLEFEQNAQAPSSPPSGDDTSSRSGR